MDIKGLLLLLDVKDVLDLPNAIMGRLCGPEADTFFLSLQSIEGWRWDCDSFQTLYEREMSERKDKKQDFMGSKWGDSIDQVKKNMGKEPDSMRGDAQMLYIKPILDYEVGIYEGFTDLGFCYANILLNEKDSDTQTKLLIAMNKAAAQLYGEAKANVNGRIIYETKRSHIEIRKGHEDIEIYVDNVSYTDDPAREGFKGVNYTVE